MAQTTSRLRARMSAESLNNGGLPWTAEEAQTEILAEVIAGTATSDQFSSIPGLLTTGVQTLQANVALSYSVTAVSGTVIISGLGISTFNLPVGITIKGGGYLARTLASAIIVDCGAAAGQAIIVVDKLV